MGLGSMGVTLARLIDKLGSTQNITQGKQLFKLIMYFATPYSKVSLLTNDILE